jgi:UDP-N-acetylmuramate--alanine ligase
MVKMRKTRHVHFVGIGGIGMSGIAEVLLNLGYRVTGSDLADNDTTARLARLGGTVQKGHRAQNAAGADVVVISSAVRPDNPEVVEARRAGIPVIPRAAMLNELMRMKYAIAVAGSHGKTSTTSMVATVLAAAGFDPTVVIGGKLDTLGGTNARLGAGDYLVAEADESDGSFLALTPTLAVVTNIDREHMDHYHTLDALRESFRQFLRKVPFYGRAVLCLDDPEVAGLLEGLDRPLVTYGLNTQAEVRASSVRLEGFTSSFHAHRRGDDLGDFRLRVPGEHNVRNALAAIAVGLELEVAPDRIRRALADFAGVQRRFSLKGEAGGVRVFDDYGHHPTEVRATLAAARAAWKGRVVVLFQPHRYSRTADLMTEFGTAFHDADLVFVTDIYAAGEEPVGDLSGADVARVITRRGHRGASFVGAWREGLDAVAAALRPGDLLLSLGAGDVWKAGEEILRRLEARG